MGQGFMSLLLSGRGGALIRSVRHGPANEEATDGGQRLLIGPHRASTPMWLGSNTTFLFNTRFFLPTTAAPCQLGSLQRGADESFSISGSKPLTGNLDRQFKH